MVGRNSNYEHIRSSDRLYYSYLKDTKVTDREKVVSHCGKKKLLSESVDKVQTMAAEMREDKVKQLFFTDCAVSTSSVHYA